MIKDFIFHTSISGKLEPIIIFIKFYFGKLKQFCSKTLFYIIR